MNREEYEAKKEAQASRQKEARERAESDARLRCVKSREAKLAKMSFLCHPDKTVKYTGYLQLFTAVLAFATAVLVGATIYTATILKGIKKCSRNQAGPGEGLRAPDINRSSVPLVGPFGWMLGIKTR
jgi:hypothetical protein